MENTTTIIGLVFMAAIIVLLMYLLKRGTITNDTIKACEAVVRDIGGFIETVTPEDSLVAQLYEYARMAVYAVEQLAKIGQIADTSDDKKAAAMQYVEDFCNADAIDFDSDLASALVESCVAELPRNQVNQ